DTASIRANDAPGRRGGRDQQPARSIGVPVPFLLVRVCIYRRRAGRTNRKAQARWLCERAPAPLPISIHRMLSRLRVRNRRGANWEGVSTPAEQLVALGEPPLGDEPVPIAPGAHKRPQGPRRPRHTRETKK